MTGKEIQKRHGKILEVNVFKAVMENYQVRELKRLEEEEYRKLRFGKEVSGIPRYLHSTISGIHKGFKDQEEIINWLETKSFESGEYLLVFNYLYVKLGKDRGDNWYGIAVYSKEE